MREQTPVEGGVKSKMRKTTTQAVKTEVETHTEAKA